MEDKTIIIIIGVIGIVVLESIALILKVDGVILSLCIAAISGLCGYVLPSPLKNSKPTE